MCKRCEEHGVGTPVARPSDFIVGEVAYVETFGAAGAAPTTRQKRLWEIESSWHCSVIGTCLTLGDLRKVARKIGFKQVSDPVADIDAYLHGSFVRSCREQSVATKMIEKILNRRHAAAVKRLHAIGDKDELSKEWRALFKKGDVPGPYWAMVSHPSLDEKLAARVYNDVHMLSHLVGSSNRAALSNLRQLEADLANLTEAAETARARASEKLRERDDRIAALEARVVELTGQLDQARDRIGSPSIMAKPASKGDARQALERKVQGLEEEALELRDRTARAEDLAQTLRSEISALEDTLSAQIEDASSVDTLFNAPVEGIADGRFLYVGGRSRAVGRMVDLLGRHGASLSHHDGGLEQSLDALAREINRADAVFFPTDCVSHSAMFRVKELCKHKGTPFIPLRTCGLASFIEGIGRLPRTKATGVLAAGLPNQEATRANATVARLPAEAMQ